MTFLELAVRSPVCMVFFHLPQLVSKMATKQEMHCNIRLEICSVCAAKGSQISGVLRLLWGS